MSRFKVPVQWSVRLFACAALVLALAVPAQAQLQTGNIFGQVVDSSGSALPGVTVTLTGSGAPRTFVTDAGGQFRFLSLSPSRYTLRAELAGLGSASRTADVNVGRNSDVQLVLNPSIDQTITVTAETPLLDVRKTGTGATVTNIELEEVPSARDPWVVMQQVPGVLMDRMNVGGNESGQQSQLVSKGAISDQTTFNVDGVNITDMVATGSSPAYYDFGSFEEIQVTTSGTDPRIQTPGAQLNMVTKRGTNELRGSGRYLATDSDWQTDPDIPADAQTYLAAVNEIDDIVDMGLEVGGPVLRDRLWLWGAYSDQQIDLFVAQPFGQETRFSDKTTLETLNFKLNAQLLDNNSLAGIWTNSEKIKLGRDAAPTRPPETTFNQGGFGPEGIWKIEDTHIFNPSFYVTGMYSKVNGGFKLIPHSGADCRELDCALTESSNPASFVLGLGHFINTYIGIEILRPSEQWRADSALFFDTGTVNHELKFGFGYREAGWATFYAWPFGYYTVDYTGFEEAFGLPTGFGGVWFQRGAAVDTPLDYTDFYVGDTMLFGNLTVQVGLRYDMQTASTGDVSLPAHSLIPEIFPALSFSGEQVGELEWESISPRIGATYALGETNRTLLRAAYNQYADQLGSGPVILNPLWYQGAYMYFVDANGNKRVERDEIIFDYGLGGWYNVNPNDPSQIDLFTRYGDNVDPVTTNEIILGIEHELMPEFTIGVNYTRRNTSDFFWYRGEKTPGSGDFYTTADYVLGGTVEGNLPPCPPTTTGSCTGSSYSEPYYVLREGVDPPNYFVLQNRPDYEQNYDGIELSLIKRLSNRWMMRGSFTWNDWTHDVGPGAIVDPTVSLSGSGCNICDGSDVVQGSGSTSGTKNGVYINSKWSYNVTGLYQIPVVEMNFGFSILGREGYPIPYVHSVGT
ncbi:MAG TPA: carboxypeptidase regulatory-like domain-containing protein, partial [Thermoanaerobaculia bacterium]|nr:carboxypeptidase regulatory-like domain-containing protein [Thermoanaerobaculia bacterium]